MSAKIIIKNLVKQLTVRSKKSKKKAGFTLTELLITMLMAAVIVSTLLSFVVDLVDTERREYARSETQRDMQTALDFIVDDLRQAVYVYDRIEQPRDGRDPLRNFIPNNIPGGQGTVPILAFWKAERLPYDESQQLPSTCAPTDSECNQVLIRRRAYSLVVYYLVKNQTNDPASKWKGESRIVRYIFRRYRNLPSLNETPGYVDPEGRFPNWPYVTGTPQGSASLSDGSAAVLVDFVDVPNNTNIEVDSCPGQAITPPTYRRVPADATQSNSFFVCVKTLGIQAGTSQTESNNQDVIVYLRGNPKGKVNDRKEQLVTLKTQAVARGVIDKKPQ